MSAEHDALDYKPLYARIRDRLVGRLVDGSWTPGMLIPSEIELAQQLGVSQGTVRKALDAMSADNLLTRRQGRGTYVAVPEDGYRKFQFFRLFPDAGERVLPDSRVTRRDTVLASAEESAALNLRGRTRLWSVERIRYLAGEPLLVETLVLRASRFPGFDKLDDIPNNVYGLYVERWGITVAAASEKLKAIAADEHDAKLLGCSLGEPLIRIERVAFDLENNPVELRISRCNTQKAHYLSELR